MISTRKFVVRVGIKAALIGAVVVFITTGIGIGWDAYNKKPVIDYMLSKETTFFYDLDNPVNRQGFVSPQDHQTMKFFLKNRGVNDGTVMVTISAEGAQVAFPVNGQYSDTVTGPHYVASEKGDWITYEYYLKTVQSPQTVTISMVVTGTDTFNQITPPSVNKLVYEKEGAGYRLK